MSGRQGAWVGEAGSRAIVGACPLEGPVRSVDSQYAKFRGLFLVKGSIGSRLEPESAYSLQFKFGLQPDIHQPSGEILHRSAAANKCPEAHQPEGHI